jgi:surfactin synthase thioesterase subunit
MIRLFRTDAAEFYRFFGEIRDAVRSGPVPDLKLACPIHCIGGARDPGTSGYPRLYRRWQIFSPDVDLMVLAEGRHYFLVDQAEDLARWISRNINPTRENHHA